MKQDLRLPHLNSKPTWDHPNCKLCGLCTGHYAGAIKPDPPATPFLKAYREVKVSNPIMVVGEAPGGVEDSTGKSFAGKTGKTLRDALSKEGFNTKEMVFVNGVRCAISRNKKPTNKQIDYCRPFLLRDIERIRPSWILVCGNFALRSVTRKSGITKQRRKIFYHTLEDGTKIPVMAAFSPLVVEQERNYAKDFYLDIKMFGQAVRGDAPEVILPDININATAEDIRAFHRKVLEAKYPEITCDLETNTLKPFLEPPKVFCAGMSDGQTNLVVQLDSFDMNPATEYSGTTRAKFNAWREIMLDENIRKTNHNIKYDMNVTEVRYGFQWANVHLCTQTLDCYINPIQVGHDLGTLASTYMNMGDFKDETEDSIKYLPKLLAGGYEPLAKRCGMDAYVTYHISKKQRAKLRKFPENEQRTFRHLVMPAMLALQRMEFNGMRVDPEHLEGLKEMLSGKMAELQKKLRSFPKSIAFRKFYYRQLDPEKRKIYKQWKRDGRPEKLPKGLTKKFLADVEKCNVKPSGDSIANIIFGATTFKGLCDDTVLRPPSFQCPFDERRGLTKTGKFSTDEEALNFVVEETADSTSELGEFVKTVLEYKKAQNWRSTFVVGLLKRATKDFDIHPTLNASRADTGRNSCSDPNLQNQPRLNEQRNAFIARPGFKLVESDLSQIELRLLAAYTKDKGLCDAYRKGLDLHSRTARRMYYLSEKEEPTKEQRSSAKQINFSVVYGKTAQALAITLGVTTEEAQEFIDLLHDEYPGILEWQAEVIEFAAQFGYVRTMFGNRRIIENARIKGSDFNERFRREAAFRQVTNTPIQGAAAQVLNCALVHIDREIIKRKLPVKLCLTVHDSLMAYVKPGAVDEYLQLADWAMSNACLPWIGDQLNGVPILAEHKVGERWGSLEEVHVKQVA